MSEKRGLRTGAPERRDGIRQDQAGWDSGTPTGPKV